MQKVIKIDNLTKSYPKTKVKDDQKTFQAVKGTSFFVEKGEIFGILGPNGAGKTTTLEIIEGLKQQTSGKVEVLGFDNIKEINKIKERIGVQLQSSQYLPFLTLGELLNLFRSFYQTNSNVNLNSKNSIAHTNNFELLKLVELEDKINDLAKNLSGGQKQRFTIAVSLVNNPEILFLDEPTTGLDPHARREMWKLIKQLNSFGTTIVITTHYMEEAEFLCNRVAIMDSGKILEIDEPRKLIERISETTQISFLTDHNLNNELFLNIPEVLKIYNNYPKITIEISSLDKISLIVNILKQNKINFSGFTVKTASLEDVYLQLTGKAYEA
jgi:ABC-2 type transport system ATP-binding protein